MLAEITHSHFAPLVGDRFKLDIGAGKSLEAELVSATKLRTVSGQKREPFSLLFRTPGNKAYLNQQMYRLEHPKLGVLDFFLVPVGLDSQGLQLEAVFN